MQQFINLAARLRAARTRCINADIIPQAFQLTKDQLSVLLGEPHTELPRNAILAGIDLQVRGGTDDNIIMVVQVPGELT